MSARLICRRVISPEGRATLIHLSDPPVARAVQIATKRRPGAEEAESLWGSLQRQGWRIEDVPDHCGRCYLCGEPAWGVCYGPIGGRKLYGCAKHQAEARAYWASKLPEDAARLDAIERGELAPLSPSREFLELTARKAAKPKAPPSDAQGSLL